MKLQDSIPATPNDPNSNLTQYPMEENSTPHRKPYVRKVWRTVAIIAAVCILLVGLSFAWLCVDFRPGLQSVSMEEIKGVCFPEKGVEGASYAPGYQFAFSVEETISMQWTINVNTGGLWTSDDDSGGNYNAFVEMYFAAGVPKYIVIHGYNGHATDLSIIVTPKD